MPITVDTLKFFQSERMIDENDGGGRMTATEIVSGADNQIFDDVSDVDRAAGDVSLRKGYGAVTSADTDKYLDAGVVVFREPADPNVSVLAFSTRSFYDQRADLQNRLEQTITRGARWNGYLWGQHITGQRAITLWQRPQNEIPPVGHRFELVANAAGVEEYSQYVWVTKITTNLRTQYAQVSPGVVKEYLVREIVCELAEALQNNYDGSEPIQADPAVSAMQTLIYSTRYNAEAVALFGIAPTVAAANTGDFSIQVDSLYKPIIPTSLSETALADTNPGGDSPAIVAGNAGTINFTTTTQCIKDGASLYLGSAAMPGTISIAVSGATLTDDNGAMKLAGATVGAVDYSNGVLAWNSSVPNYGAASKVVTFQPAVRPLRVADTAAQLVTAENRGYVYVLTLAPIPAPATLSVAYRVNNRWYVLTDQGGGQLRGVDSSYGSGSLNSATGTVTITTGELPDVDSEIIYTWATPVNYTARGGDPVDAPVIRGQTVNPGVAPGTVSVSWTVGGTTYTLDDDPAADGNLTGTGGVGFIRYATGEWWVRPSTVPAINTEFTVDYDYGPPTEETFSHPIREGNGHLHLVLAAEPRPHSVEVEWNLLIDQPEPISTTPAEMIIFPKLDPIKIIRDDGAGVLPVSGGTNGTVDYANRIVDWLPDVTIQVPWPRYSTVLLGFTRVDGAIKQAFRNTFTHFEYIDSPAMYPIDESGWVKVRYRPVGGDSSASETVTLSQLEFDLTKGYGETITAGSTRFLLGNSRYVDVAGQLYRDIAPDTGVGSLAGTLDRSTGIARITAWAAGGANAVTLTSCVTELSGQPIEEVVFRAPVSPLRPGSLQLRYQLLDGTVKTKTVDSTGLLEDTDCTITVNAPLGIVRARFGLWKVDSALTTEEKQQVWYDPDARVDFAGTLKIWKPVMVLADSVIYNAVAQVVLPPDSALLGLNAARLPPDGKGLIFRVGQLVFAHHTASLTETNLSPNQVVDCGRTRLYRGVIEDATGQRLPASAYAVDRVAGTVTMTADLDLTGFTGPYAVLHTIADLARVVQTDINGTLTLNRALSHDFPADDSRVSGVLYAGTLQARISNVFAQSTWTSVWSDTMIGSAPLAQYNNALYPIATTNAGAYTDRFLVKFTSAIAFQVIGENLGLIAVGDVNNNCAPVNALTGQTYFTLDHRGWGSGWATGNCLRFNLVGAAFPVDLIRAIQPSEPSGDEDSVELLFVGNTDA